MKTIVTHQSVDLDAVSSCWLIKKFIPGWKDAKINFVNAGSTLDNQAPDCNSDIIHVDTGFGQFDHHQTNEYTSSTKLIFTYLNNKKYLKEYLVDPLQRLVDCVNEIDHFAEAFFPDAVADHYEFMFYQIIEGLKLTSKDDLKVIDLAFPILDAILITFINKVQAEKDIKNGYIFKSKWGKSIALETNNEEAMKLALKMEYSLVIRKSSTQARLRIKTLPKKELDLTPIYNEIIKVDKKASWFLHVSKNMLLNGSSKNPSLIPSSLSLQKLIAIIKRL